jgi:peroxiredoxin
MARLFIIIPKFIKSKEKAMKLKVGKRAPEFTLPSHLGKDVTLSHLRGKTVLLVFFPLAWTPV